MELIQNGSGVPATGAGDSGTDLVEVAITAFHLWDDDGRPEGRSADYWLAAKAQLRAKYGKPFAFRAMDKSGGGAQGQMMTPHELRGNAD